MTVYEFAMQVSRGPFSVCVFLMCPMLFPARPTEEKRSNSRNTRSHSWGPAFCFWMCNWYKGTRHAALGKWRENKEGWFFFSFVYWRSMQIMTGVCQYGNKCLNLLSRALKTSGSATSSSIKPPAVRRTFTGFYVIYYF